MKICPGCDELHENNNKNNYCRDCELEIKALLDMQKIKVQQKNKKVNDSFVVLEE